MIETSSSVRVGGPVYHAAAMVAAAIDAACCCRAALLFFDGTTESEQRAIAERDAVEREEKPWSIE